jgi:MFS family permease
MRARTQYYCYNAGFNGARAAYISTYSLYLVDTLKLPLAVIPWLLTLNLVITMLCEVPTGAFADIYGRRTSFLVACGVSMGGYGIYALAPSLAFSQAILLPFIAACLAEALLAVAFTFYSGALDAWAVDSIATSDDSTLRHLFAHGQFWKNVVYVFGGVIGILIFFSSKSLWISPFTLSFILSCPVLVHSYAFMEETQRVNSHSQFRNPTSRAARHLAQSTSLLFRRHDLLLLTLASAVSCLFLQLIVFFWPYFVSYGAGVGPAGRVQVALTLVGTWVLAYLVRAAGNVACRNRVFANSALAAITVALLVNSLPVILLYISARMRSFGISETVILATCLIAYSTIRFGDGIGEPLRQVFFNARIDAKARATLLSLNSMIAMLVSALGLAASSVAIAAGATIPTVWIVAMCAQLVTIYCYKQAFERKPI